MTVTLIAGLGTFLNATPIGATTREKPLLSWANGAGASTVEVGAGNLVPGDVVTRRLLVTNPASESVLASLEVSSVGDDSLAQVLDVEIKSGVRNCIEPAAADTGTIEASGTAAATELGPRRLRPTSTLRLCVRVTMRLDADNSVQGQSAVTTVRLVTTPAGSGAAP